MSLGDIIRRRRMTRKFAGVVAVERVAAMCDIARRAPSAGFSQGVHFVVLGDGELEAFWDASGAGSWFGRKAPGVTGASVLVLVYGDPRAYLDRYGESDKQESGLSDPDQWSVPFWLTDAAMATQNLLLLLEEERLGALFFGLFKGREETAARFGVPGHLQCLGVVAVGERHPDDRPSGSPTRRRRLSTAEIVHIGGW